MATPDLTELDGSEVFDNWDQLMGNSLPTKEADTTLDGLMGDLQANEKGQDYWVDLFQQENFAGMDLMGVQYHPYSLNEKEFHQQMQPLKKAFLNELVTVYINDLRSADLSEESIFYLSKGHLPVNWTIHLKYPLLYGGKMTLDNLVLIQCYPFHELIHNYLNKQMISAAGLGHPKTLYIPIPLGKVYIPNGEMTGSGGKKKADRSATAGLTAANLQQVAIKTGGR